MFRKILVAARGEIAVRIIQTCKEIGISTVALFTESDIGSLHVRLADECVLINSPADFSSPDTMIQIALKKGADAIHPGYGILASLSEFASACKANRITFIGPSEEVLKGLSCRFTALEQARQSGFSTVPYSSRAFDGTESDSLLKREAHRLGYPLIIKPCHSGSGLYDFLVRNPKMLESTIRDIQQRTWITYGDRRIFMEKAIFPFHKVGVQIMGDHNGHVVNLGDHESLLFQGNRKVFEESPAPCLAAEKREELLEIARRIAFKFEYQNAGTMEFLVDEGGKFYFSEIKPRIHLEHPLAEMLTQVDVVEKQLLIAAEEPLDLQQSDINIKGWALLGRINAEDPWNRFLPSPGTIYYVRFPTGAHIRIDTFIYSGCTLSGDYDPLISKLTVWGKDRIHCLQRFKRALGEFKLAGIPTNLTLLQQILSSPDFMQAAYNREFTVSSFGDESKPVEDVQHLAVAAAVIYSQKSSPVHRSIPERFMSGWHRNSRELPR